MSRYGPRRTAEIRAEMIRLRCLGEPWAQLRRRFAVSEDWCRRYVVQHPDYSVVEHALTALADIHYSRALELRARGVCWKLIARDLRVDSWDALLTYVTRRQQHERDTR